MLKYIINYLLCKVYISQTLNNPLAVIVYKESDSALNAIAYGISSSLHDNLNFILF